MKLLKSVLLASIATLSFNTFAVDGYQKAKFGMSEQEVKKLYKCNWQKDDDNGIYCENFKLGSLNTEAWFYFIDNKFERAAFLIPDESIEGVTQAIQSKYRLSTPLPNEATNPQPNQMYDAGFDHDTVFIRFAYENDMSVSTLLIYSSPEFDEKETNRQKQKVNDAL